MHRVAFASVTRGDLATIVLLVGFTIRSAQSVPIQL